MMKALFLTRKDSNVMKTKLSRIIHRSCLDQKHVGQSSCQYEQVCTALPTELTRYCIGNVGTRESFGLTVRVSECCLGIRHPDMWVATGEVLAFSTMTLSPE